MLNNCIICIIKGCESGQIPEGGLKGRDLSFVEMEGSKPEG